MVPFHPFPSLILFLIPALLGLARAANLTVAGIIADLAKAVDCPSCHVLLVPLQELARLGDDAFVNVFTEICITLQIADPDVCTGNIGFGGPLLAHDLRQMSTTGQTATKFCDALFGLCNPPPVNALKFPLPPPPAKPKVFRSTGKKPFQVVHMSDVHIDREYVVGSNANCTKNICCRDFADSPPIITDPAGPNGNSRCDSPVTLANSLLEEINQIGRAKDADLRFSIFTGDVVEGATWLAVKAEVTNDLADFDAQMAAILDKPVFPSLGNHDSFPVNAFPRTTTDAGDLNTQWVFDTQSAGWARWIGETAAQQVAHMSGSYSAVPEGTNLRIISINTQFWYKQNFWLYDSDVQQPDPNGILAFIVQELFAAEQAGQRAWLMGHIPLGKEDTLNDQSNYYDQIVQRFKNTIAGQFFGHSHKDQFEIAYSDYNDQTAANAVSIALIAPALTPTSGNPAFKLYDVDPDTYELMDASVYFTNISDPNFQVRPTWGLYYSTRATFGPLVDLPPTTPLTPAFWHNLTDVFTYNDTAFQLFNTHISRGGAVTACVGDCKNVTICDMRAFRAENNCDNPTPGFALRRRGADGLLAPRDSSACEGEGIGHIFSNIAMKASNPL